MLPFHLRLFGQLELIGWVRSEKQVKGTIFDDIKASHNTSRVSWYIVCEIDEVSDGC